MERLDEIKQLIVAGENKWISILRSNKELYNIFLKVTNPAIKYVNKPNMSLRKTVLFEDILEPALCPVCGEPISLITKSNKTQLSIFRSFCSDSCKYSSKGQEICNQKAKNAIQDKFGVDYNFQAKEVKEKIKETCLEKYGVEHASQSEEIKEKKKKTCLEKYGVENPSQIEEIQEKRKRTYKKNYGVENPGQSEKIKEKNKKIMIELYGSENYQQSPKARTENLEKLKKFMKTKNIIPLFSDEDYIYSQVNDELRYKCLTCNKELSLINDPKENKGLYYYNFICTCSRNRSRHEIELAEFLESLHIEFKNNERRSNEEKTLELDLYIPEQDFGIEYHGLYWHCEVKKSKDYHQEKYLFFKEKGIDVIQIFGNEWASKRHIIESIIKRRLGKSENIITSEDTEVRIPSYQDYLQFLEENSIYSIPSTLPTQILGLYHNDTLVQLLALNKSNIISYNTKLDYSITNGLSKLLSNLKQDLIASVDLRYSTGKEFIDCGFTQVQLTEPNCLYTDLKYIHPTQLPNTKKIHDCGNLILSYKSK